MSSNVNIPESFLCPITHNIMCNPHIDNDGNTYEYNAILQWLENNNTSPITRNYLHYSHLKPNRSLLELIINFNSNNNNNISSISNNINNISNNNSSDISTENNFTVDDYAIKLSIDKYISDVDYSYFKLNININDNDLIPPIDIVAVIDVSGSMDASAKIQQNGKSIDIGFTILDITKHALNTILESMKPTDRISIITFSNEAQTICNLTYINDSNKEIIKSQINSLQTKGATNIWAGLNMGLEQYYKDNNNVNRVKSLLFLTDGIASSHLSPPRGILETLQRKLKIMSDSNLIIPNIYTFGFGNDLDTDLLVNIAKYGKGHFSYIPDSGFVGTIFIHSLAYINTLFCNTANIDLEFMCDIFKQNVKILGYKDINNIDLNTLHIGNNRHLIFKILTDDLKKCSDYLAFTLKYKTIQNENRIIQLSIDKNKEQNIDDNGLYYNIKRLELIDALNFNNINELQNNLNIYLNKENIPTDINDDLEQLNMAANFYYNSWGINYIKSFQQAHFEERCNNFKDNSIQKYGGKLFYKIRDNIDDIFSKLPPPIPTNNSLSFDIDNKRNNYTSAKSFSNSFNCSNNGCFHEDSNILIDTIKFKKIKDIKKGDYVIDMHGNYNKVICVVKYSNTNNKTNLIELDSGTIITPFHPLLNNNDWIFPYTIGKLKEYNTEYVYNLILDKGHTIIINSDICVTLGHNINTNFVVSHQYFGTNKVIQDLEKKLGYKDGLVYITSDSIIRSTDTGRVIKIV